MRFHLDECCDPAIAAGLRSGLGRPYAWPISSHYNPCCGRDEVLTSLETGLMSRARFRIRTIMILIAALAVLFGTARILAARSRLYFASATIEGADVKIGIERLVNVPGDVYPADAAPIYFIVDQNIRIPLRNIAFLTFGIVGILAVAYRHRSNRRRRGQVFDDADRGIE
jgi:hypothetical protein